MFLQNLLKFYIPEQESLDCPIWYCSWFRHYWKFIGNFLKSSQEHCCKVVWNRQHNDQSESGYPSKKLFFWHKSKLETIWLMSDGGLRICDQVLQCSDSQLIGLITYTMTVQLIIYINMYKTILYSISPFSVRLGCAEGHLNPTCGG